MKLTKNKRAYELICHNRRDVLVTNGTAYVLGYRGVSILIHRTVAKKAGFTKSWTASERKTGMSFPTTNSTTKSETINKTKKIIDERYNTIFDAINRQPVINKQRVFTKCKN